MRKIIHLFALFVSLASVVSHAEPTQTVEDSTSLPSLTFQQTWKDLLYAHWKVPVELIRNLVPAPLEVETFEGSAYLSIAAFEMNTFNSSFIPALGYKPYNELNFRTYVRYNGVSGIYLFSVDASNKSVVEVSKYLFGLPLIFSNVMIDRAKNGNLIHFESDRPADNEGHRASLNMTYQVSHEAGHVSPESLTSFLVDRYQMLFVDKHQCVHVGNIKHNPYDLFEVEIKGFASTLPRSIGLGSWDNQAPIAAEYVPYMETTVLPFERLGCGPSKEN